MGKRKGIIKARKLVGWGDEMFNKWRREKKNKPCDAEKIHYLPWVEWCTARPRQMMGNLPKPPLFPFNCWARHYMAWSTSGYFGSPGWLCSLPNSYKTHSIFTEKWKALVLYKTLFSHNSSITVLPALIWSEIQNTAPHKLLWRKLTPAQLCTNGWVDRYEKLVLKSLISIISIWLKIQVRFWCTAVPTLTASI